MKRLFIPLVVLGMLLTMAPAVAADDTAIGVVTVSETCVLIGDGLDTVVLDYGSLGLSQPAGAVNGTRGSTYTNCSTDPAQIYAQGTTAASTTTFAAWSLLGSSATCSFGTDYYDVFVVDGASGFGVNLLESFAQVINPSAVVDTPTAFDATLTMPCSGSSGVGETMTFQIILTAAF